MALIYAHRDLERYAGKRSFPNEAMRDYVSLYGWLLKLLFSSVKGEDPDTKRNAYTAVAIKMARIVHAVIKQQTDYRGYYESH